MGQHRLLVVTEEGFYVGIGLFVARRIAESHGWSLTASDRPEGGARYSSTVSSPSRTWTSASLPVARTSSTNRSVSTSIGGNVS
jgi:hypothetical protein